jgi:hypothetical protein
MAAHDGAFFWINKGVANINDKTHVSVVNSFLKARESIESAQSGKYLWINRGVASITDTASTSEVNSFVQKDGKFHKRERLKKFQASIKTGNLHWLRRVDRATLPHRGKVAFMPYSETDGKHPAALRAVSSTSRDPMAYLMARQQVPTFPSNDNLDPFLPLAGPVTHRDRNMLHYYLSLMPSAVYGTSKDAPDCLVRDQTIPFVQMNDTWLRWVLVLAETHRLGTAAAEISPSILARKTYLYRIMFEMVANTETRYSDITITALSYASWAEGRSSTLEKAQNHLLGVKHLVQARGGFARLDLKISTPILYPFVWLGVGAGFFPDVRSLESAIAAFLRLMRSMQEWQWQYQQDFIWSYLADVADSRVQDHDFQEYVQARTQAFGPLSALRPFLQVPFYDLTNRIQYRSHVTVLWMLNKTLWELRGDPSLCSRFLRELDRRVTDSDDTAQCLNRAVTGELDVLEIEKLGLAKREPTLKATAVIHIIVCCAMRAKWPPEAYPPIPRWYDSPSCTTEAGDGFMPTIVRLFETVDGVELLQFLSEHRRQRVLAQLSVWLIGDKQTPQSPEHTNLSNTDLETIAAEMRSAWVKAQRPKSRYKF